MLVFLRLATFAEPYRTRGSDEAAAEYAIRLAEIAEALVNTLRRLGFFESAGNDRDDRSH